MLYVKNIKFKNSYTNLILIFLLIFTTAITSLIIELLYSSTDGLDFFHYSNYINYFSGNLKQTNYENGLSYFYIVYFFINKIELLITNENYQLVINSGIIFSNFLIFSFGLYGLYKLLSIFNFKKSNILISLLLLNFFPPAIGMRMTMKPEMLAFGILPWIFYFLEKYKKTESFKFLILSFPLLILIFTTRPSIAVMVFLILSIFYLKLIKVHNRKQIIWISISFIILYLLLSIENYNANKILFFNHNVYQNYLFKPKSSFFYNINPLKLITDPYRHIHKDSLISIILLDTFDDYFQFFWKNDESIFSLGNKNFTSNFFIFNYLRQYIAILLSLIFYTLILIFSYKNQKYKKFLVLPFFGILILIVNSLGVPSKNFDPLTADTFKSHYFSFLLCIAFVFLVNLVFQITKFRFIVIFSIIFIFLCIFILGFPKEELKIDSYLNEKILLSYLCESTTIFLSSVNSEDCNNPVHQICKFNYYILDTDSLSNDVFDSSRDFFPKSLRNHYGEIKNVVNTSQCIHAVNQGYYQNITYSSRPLPLINLFFILMIIFSVLYDQFSEIYKFK